MNINTLTIKTQETLQGAINLAQQNQNQAIEPVHLLKSLFQTAEDLMRFIGNKIGVNHNLLLSITDNILQSLPKVSGGEPYLSRDTNNVIQKAEGLTFNDFQVMFFSYVSCSWCQI